MKVNYRVEKDNSNHTRSYLKKAENGFKKAEGNNLKTIRNWSKLEEKHMKQDQLTEKNSTENYNSKDKEKYKK